LTELDEIAIQILSTESFTLSAISEVSQGDIGIGYKMHQRINLTEDNQ